MADVQVATKVSRARRQQESGRGHRSPAKEGQAAGVKGVHHPQELRRAELDLQATLGCPPPESMSTLSPLWKMAFHPALGPSPFSGGDWGCSWDWSSTSNWSLPTLGAVRQLLRPVETTGPALPPSNKHSPEASRGVWPLGSRGTFCHHTVKLLRGPWLEIGAQPRHPGCSPASLQLWQRGQE